MRTIKFQIFILIITFFCIISINGKKRKYKVPFFWGKRSIENIVLPLQSSKVNQMEKHNLNEYEQTRNSLDRDYDYSNTRYRDFSLDLF